MYDYLIVGTGLFGSIFAYEANKRGKKCLVIDKRPNVAGNIYTENVDGINVHKYGAHIFMYIYPINIFSINISCNIWSFIYY